jgi:hypothetical protein
MEQKATWARLILEAANLKSGRPLVEILEAYKTLTRLEAVFLFQVKALLEVSEQASAMQILKLMIDVANKILKINDHIRRVRGNLTNLEDLPEEIRLTIAAHDAHRKDAESHFRHLLLLLDQIGARST